MVNKTALKNIMETYTDITKNAIICMDMKNLETPLFTVGLDVLSLIEYANFKEYISFYKDKSEQIAEGSDKPSTFYTFCTKNLFTYNIVFLKDNVENQIALVAGPILSYLPNNESINSIISNNNVPYYKKNELIEILNSLPLASGDRINQLGKLLLALSKTDMDSWIISRQEINGRRNSEDEERRNYQKDNINIDLSENDLHASYRFSVLMMKKIVHGEVNGIRDIISEYTKLFLRLASVTDNNRILKDKCIVISTIACHFAIQSNVSYERMINMLWRSIVELEKLKTSNDIISQMETTIERFAQAVSTLSEKGYSLHINRCFNYIKSHLSENITLKKLADHVQLSPVYLSSLIKKETNQSLSYYINLFRIEESKRLLIYTNKSMQEIACDLGYSYQTHFNTVFKKYERQTPLEYRKKTGDKNYEDIY